MIWSTWENVVSKNSPVLTKSVHLSSDLAIFIFCLNVCLFVCKSVCLFVCKSVWLFVCLSVCLFINYFSCHILISTMSLWKIRSIFSNYFLVFLLSKLSLFFHLRSFQCGKLVLVLIAFKIELASRASRTLFYSLFWKIVGHSLISLQKFEKNLYNQNCIILLEQQARVAQLIVCLSACSPSTKFEPCVGQVSKKMFR